MPPVTPPVFAFPSVNPAPAVMPVTSQVAVHPAVPPLMLVVLMPLVTPPLAVPPAVPSVMLVVPIPPVNPAPTIIPVTPPIGVPPGLLVGLLLGRRKEIEHEIVKQRVKH
jgi:hypothetical protein